MLMGQGIELLNEPRLSSDSFTMTDLKSFYSAGSSTIHAAKPNGLNVTVHGEVTEYFYPFDRAHYMTSSNRRFLRSTVLVRLCSSRFGRILTGQ